MSVDCFFDPPTLDISTLNQLRIDWSNITDRQLQEIIIREVQYLTFQKFILNSLRHTHVGNIGNPTYSGMLDLSLRCTAIKSTIFTCCSIMEAILLYHAIRRKYKLPENTKQRSFGKVIEAWEKSSDGKNELGKNLRILKWFKNERDCIHLYRIKLANLYSKEYYSKLYKNEELILKIAGRIIEFLKNIH